MKYLKKYKFFENKEFWHIPNISKLLIDTFSQDINSKTLNDIKSEFINNLYDYQEGLIEMIDSGNIEEIDINYDINNITNNLNPTVAKELDLLEFLRMLNNLIRVPKRKNNVKIEKLFNNYIDTLTQRFQRLLDVAEGKIIDKGEDRFEDDKSVLTRDEFEDELYELQVQMNRLQKWVKATNKKVAIIFEGRDAAGKGSAIKTVVEHMPTKSYRIVAMDIPTKEEMDGDNWFKRYEKEMPKDGEIVFFDRSWYGMALVNPTMGYCTEEQYKYFMNNVNEFEETLKENNIYLIKFWFSITQEKQLLRFKIRQDSELKYWKFSTNDLKSIDKWDIFTKFKEQCFNKTSTYKKPLGYSKF